MEDISGLHVPKDQHEGLLKSLQKNSVSSIPAGWIIGIQDEDVLLVLSFVRCTRPRDGETFFKTEAEDLCSILPKGLLVIGAYGCLKPGGPGASEVDACLKDLSAAYLQLRGAMLQIGGGEEEDSWEGCLAAALLSDTAQAQLAPCSITASNGWTSTWHLSDVRGKAFPLDVVDVTEEMPQLLWRRHAVARCQMSINVVVRVPAEQNKAREAYQAAAESALDSDKAVFIATWPSATGSGVHASAYVDPSLASRADQDSSRLDSGVAAGVSGGGEDVLQDFMKGGQEIMLKTAGGGQIPVPLQLTLRVRSGHGGQRQVSGPLLSYEPGSANETLRQVQMDVDVLCVCPKQWTLRHISARLMLPGLKGQLAAFGALAVADPADNIKLSAFHFLPPGLPHPITALYSLSRGEAEARAEAARSALHARLGLPPDRPMLRSANALSFGLGSASSGTAPSGLSSATRLVDVHVGLPPSGVAGGVASLVQGSYEYYHYMQDRIDDGGWGCAYRSLQTIVSWFRLQHYTAAPVPPHRAIQQALVDIGDKEPAFVGSSKWIGAIELSYILDHLIGVSCKILTVQSGADMPSKGRELARHFQTQGTPVMIGGGVLAYTLLGVDFNELTGECAFLILDPHYTGGEDLKSIRQGGWCGWKHPVNEAGQSFFVRDAFYNLLLPQRPSTV